MALVDWPTAESAIQAWLAGIVGSAIPVIWANQGNTRPSASVQATAPQAFVSISHDGGDLIGSVAETIDTYDSSAPSGQEITLTTRMPTDFNLTVDVFSNTVIGANSAVNIANKLRGSWGNESTINSLEAAGVAIRDCTGTKNLTGVLTSDYEGRAQFTVRLGVMDGGTDVTTYIETVVGIQGALHGGVTDPYTVTLPNIVDE